MILTQSKTFFVHYTEPDFVSKYKDALALDMYACMELSRSSYIEIALMPVKRFYDYLKWKSELEEEKQKQMEEESSPKEQCYEFS